MEGLGKFGEFMTDNKFYNKVGDFGPINDRQVDEQIQGAIEDVVNWASGDSASDRLSPTGLRRAKNNTIIGGGIFTFGLLLTAAVPRAAKLTAALATLGASSFTLAPGVAALVAHTLKQERS